MEVQMYFRGGPHCPGMRAWPSTKPVLAPTKVTEVAWKLPGAGGARGGAELDGTADGVGDGRCCPDGLAEDVFPAAAPLEAGPGPTFSWVITSRGTTAMTAMPAPAPAAAAAARVTLRRRARFLISSKVPGGGGSGCTWACIQASRSSRGSGICVPEGRAQPGPGLEEVGFDGSLRAAEHRGHLADREARVVVQQERAAQPV